MKISIQKPKTFLFSTDIPVLITDINYGRHLGNDRMVGIIHEARVRFLKHFGHSEFDIQGRSLILSALAVKYLKECFHGDMLSIQVGIGDISKARVDMIYDIKNQNETCVCLASTTLAFIDYETKKVLTVPEFFMSL